MRYLRIAVVLLFIISCFLYTGAAYIERQTTDTTMPRIESSEEVLEQSVEDPQEDLFRGLKASDKKDGDLTDQIMISSMSYFTEPGVSTVKYVVFDSANNSAVYERKVHYKDYRSPRFYAEEPLCFMVGDNIRFLDYIKAEDVLDGDISRQIKIKFGNISNFTAGVYPVVLEVVNRFGDSAEVELNIVVKEGRGSKAEIRLDEYITYVPLGTEFHPESFIKSAVDEKGNQVSTENVMISGSVNTEEEGCYPLTYSLGSGENAAETYLTVVVQDEEK